ncbi:MAG: patatin-like phospholipase family protein [Bacteroidetes bacterium]|nr:patatin-like phospholipase family protein [Bacteroidota bacterium]
MAKPNGPQMDPARAKAFAQLGIDPSRRTILCLDGGGMRGILTIQLLKKLEETAGIPCYQLFDMVAGTSTGGIIAGLIVTGHNAVEIEKMYQELVTQVFDKRSLGNRFVNPPAFSKSKYRELLKGITDDITLQAACAMHDLDMMITARDMAASEETFFSCFKQPDGSYYGTYKGILLRSAMEATMSAPTYFFPLERFVDGGTTTYNNPSLAAYMEAVSYSRPDKNEALSDYKIDGITLFSFGTGISLQFIKPEDTINPKGIDLVFWLNWLMTVTGQDASAMQVDAMRSPMIRKAIDFRRFQISLDPTAIRLLPNTDALDEHKYGSKWLHDLDEKILGDIDMADITRFDLMQVIGQQMAEYIIQGGNGFKGDLAARNRDLLVTASGDIVRIQKQMSDPKWLDAFKA